MRANIIYVNQKLKVKLKHTTYICLPRTALLKYVWILPHILKFRIYASVFLKCHICMLPYKFFALVLLKTTNRQIQRQVSIFANILHNMVLKSFIWTGSSTSSLYPSFFFEILFLFLTEPDIYMKNHESFFKKKKKERNKNFSLVWLLFMLLFHTSSSMTEFLEISVCLHILISLQFCLNPQI